MKWEKVHENRLSSDPIEDSNQAKRYFDCFLDDKSPAGFLYSIEQNPYGLLFISQIQVNFSDLIYCLFSSEIKIYYYLLVRNVE